jgi:D-glycero-D-manno-heptose 1,7-bisphosphate phosphatase
MSARDCLDGLDVIITPPDAIASGGLVLRGRLMNESGELRDGLMDQSAAPRRVALIDRDGTIIVDKVYLRDPDGIEFAPGAIEGLRLLRDAGFALVLITNQSGIARGYFDAARLEQIHDRLRSMLAAEGLRLEAIYVCPHGPDEKCACRKPAPGMVTSAMRDLGFGPDEAVLIGDSDADMGAAAAAGVVGLRVTSAGKSAGAPADFLEAARRARVLLAEREGGQAGRN